MQKFIFFYVSACQRFGIWFSRAGNGVSHPVHMERFGIPGKTLLGTDSPHMRSRINGYVSDWFWWFGSSSSDGWRSFHVKMPRIWGVKLVGELQPWVSAKDIIFRDVKTP